MIEIKNLSFSYGKKQVFTDFSTLISNNFITLLGGPNGSGKTTLLQLIGGVQKPDSGSIIINGHDIAKLKAHEQAELRSIAPQRRIFELPFTVQQIFAIIKPKHRAAHAEDVFEALDLYDLFPLKVTELSLGQQQRVSVALALIQSAEYYLLDEPLSAQDSAYTQKLLDLITVLSKTTGILVISHNTGHLAQYFDESIYLS
jgi:ABC-type cobalamin/Fe3+-siderophores transport system ATPase subunit